MKTNNNKRGQSLVLSYMVVLILTIYGGSFLGNGMTVNRHADYRRLDAEAYYLAQGGIEDAIAQFTNAIANFEVDASVARYPEDGTLETAFVPSTSFPDGAVVNSVVEETEPGQTTVEDPDGINVFVKTYRVSTTAVHPLDPDISVTLHRMVTRRLIYTFQHAVFYDLDLEMLPGPNMTLSGRVHSNGDIYLDSHNTLTIDSTYLRAVGDFYNFRKDDGSALGGDVRALISGSSSYAGFSGMDSTDPDWATESTTRWNGSVRSGVHGVTELVAPAVGSIDPGGYYDQMADVRVVNDTLYNEGGTPLVEGVDIPVGTVTTTTSFYNNREGKWVRMTEVDMRKLAGYADSDPDGSPSFPNRMPSNGLLYATRDDAPATHQPGVRLVNGNRIERSGGLTVVSNLPVYVKGDYNTTSKHPSAVICDAVNFLSNNWNDANSFSALNTRQATNTTVNLAIIAGIDNTETGSYNGGLENYPRLHENWTGDTLQIRGSFVALWNSQIAQGAWAYGGTQYTAPLRNWNYDTDFSSGNLPPFTPWAVEAERGAFWRE